MGIVWTSIFWLIGIFSGDRLDLLPPQWVILTLICALASFLLRKHHTHRNLFLLMLVFTLAGFRVQLDQTELSTTDLGYYNDLDLQSTVIGFVIDDPDRREGQTILRVRAERLMVPDLEIARLIEGDVLVYANPYEEWSYGDWVRVKGGLETPPVIDSFSYKDYLARKEIYSWIPRASVMKLGDGRGSTALRWVYQLRQRLKDIIFQIFPEPEGSLVSGILLGIESSIPESIYEDFNRTGTTHIIAISGFNITLIANLMIVSSRRFFGARRGLWIAGLGITFYTVLVGADAAVVRAAVMGALALLARYSGRRTDGLASLGASSLVMTLIEPDVLWDVGFQLSFAATLGLVLYAQPLHDWAVSALSNLVSDQKAKAVGASIAEFMLYTLAAQITTWPLTMFYFRRFSLISFLINPLILPLQPALMILSGAAAVFGLFWMPLGRVLAYIAWPFPALTIRLVSSASSVAAGGFGISNFSAPFLGFYYAGLIMTTLIVQNARSKSLLKRHIPHAANSLSKGTAWMLAFAALTTSVVWQSAAHSPDGLMYITFLDVGSGDALLIRSPSGRHVLIDGGPSPSKLLNHLGRRLPLLNREISALVIAGTHTNQVGGLRGLANHLEIKRGFVPPVYGSYSFRRVKEELLSEGIRLEEIGAGHRLDIGGDAYLDILASADCGLIILARYHEARILIPTCNSAEMTEFLVQNPIVHQASALMLSDGGHPSANSQRWIAAVDPAVVLLSIGSSSDPGRPSLDVIAQLGDRSILRTDENGSIMLISDGYRLWVEADRVSDASTVP